MARIFLEPKWVVGLEEIVARVEVGIGLHMPQGTWRLIEGGDGEL